MARAIGINHVALEVGDVEAAADFYRAVFDLPLRGRAPGMGAGHLEKSEAARKQLADKGLA